MSYADILFQYYSTTANTTTTEAELAFQAGPNGPTMITSLFAASSVAGNNVYRVHHCSETEEPDPSNCLLYARSTATSSLPNAVQSLKIILNPGDRLFCQLHSGNGITLTGYGLRPIEQTTRDLPGLRDLTEQDQMESASSAGLMVNINALATSGVSNRGMPVRKRY